MRGSLVEIEAFTAAYSDEWLAILMTDQEIATYIKKF
jgi:hypothetical protein